MRFRTKVFVASLAAAVVTVAVATALVAWSVRRQTADRIERQLVAEARLAAELLARGGPLGGPAAIDDEADAIAALIGARVTLIAPDGRVVGDSAEDGAALAALENHGSRPEILEARARGLGVSRRHSTTIQTDMLYVAVPVAAPVAPVTYVRLALPLTEVQQQLGLVARAALTAMGVGLLAALALAWGMSALLAGRVKAIAAVARRYAAGDLSSPAGDYGADEIGTVAHVLDGSVRELGRRLVELAKDRALMEAILSGMVEGLLVVDAAGRVQLANAAARGMLGLDDRVGSRHYLEIVRHPAVSAQIAAALEGQEPPAAEVILNRDPDRSFLARASPVRAPGAPGAVLVLHDVTDLKRADRIRRDFVANVSHELRTPLTAIRGYVEALVDESGREESSESNRRFLDVIQRHAARMERLVRDLLRLARLDAGQELLDVADCSTAGLFADVQSEVVPLIDARRDRLTFRVAPGAETVCGDPAKLHDILRNLVENAVHHTPDGTVIDLSAERNGGTTRLRVADSGPGISEADRQRVFERFYRVDKARARGAQEGGTGLGLAIVKHLVGLHGGTVEASNRPEGGAVFTVTLPRP
jgi:two-component system phosphate regulon sensor histidine kinase PhoR